jgi:hypothetical protein
VKFESAESLQETIKDVLDRMEIDSKMCNLFVDNRTKGFLNEFELKATCFGDFLDSIVDQAVKDLDSEDEQLMELKQVLGKLYVLCIQRPVLSEKTPLLFNFLVDKCKLPPEVRTLLDYSVETRWFMTAARVEKLINVLHSHYDSIIQAGDEVFFHVQTSI